MQLLLNTNLFQITKDMNNKIYILLIAAILNIPQIWAFPTQKYDFYVDGLYYALRSEKPGEVEVVHNEDYLNLPTDLNIPKTITIDSNEIAKTYAVTKIGDNAFPDCQNLKIIILPESINTLGKYAFCNCVNLELINYPDAIEDIGSSAFERCSHLTYIKIPPKIYRIEDSTFAGAGTKADNFKIEGLEHVTHILRNGFGGVPITDASCLKNIESVSPYALSECNFTEIDFRLFTRMGESLTTSIIYNYAFSYCKNLKRIYLPNGNWDGLDDGLIGCQNIEFIHIESSYPPELIGDWAAGLPRNCVVEVPEESLEAYRNHPQWGRFANIQAISSVEKLQTDASIKNEPGAITVTGANNVSIINLNGITVYRGESGCINLPAGFYIVMTDGVSHKVNVK